MTKITTSLEQHKSILEQYQMSLFDNSFSKFKLKDISLFELLNMTTKENDIFEKINTIRSTDSLQASEIKKTLPCVTLSGTFSQRNIKGLTFHSGLLQIDIDKVENLELIKETLKHDSNVFVMFVSPSNNGLKCIVKIDGTKHLEYFKHYQKYFLETYNIAIDTKCKDVSRLMYISHDKEIFINPKAMIVDITNVDPIKKQITLPTPGAKKEPGTKQKTYPKDVVECWKFTEQKESYTKGNRNAFIMLFGSNGNRAGLNEIEVLQFALDNCTDLTESEIKTTITSAYKNTLEHGKYKYKPLAEAKNIIISIPSDAENVENKKEDIKVSTPTTRKNKNLPMITQVEEYLTEHYYLRKNIVLNVTEYKERDNEKSTWKPCNENALSRNLQKNYFNYSPSKTGALIYSDFVEDYNPFIDYFKGLKPYDKDNEPNYIENLCTYIKAKNQLRFNSHFTKMLLRSVTCSLVEKQTNDNFNKHVFVLFNDKQSSGKSTFCQWLCPPALLEYYTQDFDASNKDALISLAQKFIINFDELAGLSKWEIGKLKSIISQPSVNVRHPFEKKTQTDARRVNFVGSTNERTFLTDDTGSVRWLIFEIESIDFKYKEKIDINDIWRQAYSYYLAGYKGKLTADEIKENEEENKEHKITTPEYESVITYFEKGVEKVDRFYTATDILNELCKLQLSNGKMNINQIGKVCNQLGFEKKPKKIGVNNVYGYWLKLKYQLNE